MMIDVRTVKSDMSTLRTASLPLATFRYAVAYRARAPCPARGRAVYTPMDEGSVVNNHTQAGFLHTSEAVHGKYKIIHESPRINKHPRIGS